MKEKSCKKCQKPFIGDGRRKYCDNCTPRNTVYMRGYSKKSIPKEKQLAATRKYAVSHREEISSRGKLRRWEERERALLAYGNKCVCCGETEIKFLTIDHINRDGGVHRKELFGSHTRGGAGAPYYRELRKLGYPKDMGLQVLCWNCHMAKDQYGTCPHQEMQRSI